ncbi:MAG: TetR family transcriptional regulator, partial [Erythrobacter sp.]|nr:TetR family transcriptional regulator [Erythrobacter sp.]
IEQAALAAFLRFAAEHKEVYRIIDEAEFVDPASYREHYETIAARIADRLRAGAAGGEFRDGLGELEAWAVMGMNVFAGLRYVVWGKGEVSPDEVAIGVNRLLAEGILRR